MSQPLDFSHSVLQLEETHLGGPGEPHLPDIDMDDPEDAHLKLNVCLLLLMVLC